MNRGTTTPKRILRLLKPWAQGKKQKAKTTTTPKKPPFSSFWPSHSSMRKHSERKSSASCYTQLLLTLTSLSLNLIENQRKETEKERGFFIRIWYDLETNRRVRGRTEGRIRGKNFCYSAWAAGTPVAMWWGDICISLVALVSPSFPWKARQLPGGWQR